MFSKFKAATPNQQILVALGAAGLVSILLTLTWFCFVRTTYEPLFSDLKITDASTIVSEMDRKKISYRLANGGTTILVPSGSVDSIRLALTGEDMPLKGTVGFELFNKADLGLTDFAQKINYQRALQGELERTIMTLDGVDTARVHLSLGEDRLFRDDRVAPKASVTIHMAKGMRLADGFADGVRRLVAAAVPKLDPADVVILDEGGRPIGVNTETPSASKMSPTSEGLQAMQQYYEARLRQALLEAGFSTVTVSVSPQLASADSGSLSEWTPATRSFPLHIVVRSATAWTAEQQNMIRETIRKAAASNNQADVVAVETTSLDAVAGNVRSTPLTSARASEFVLPPVEKDDQGLSLWFLFGFPIAVVLLAAFWLLRKSRGPRPLDNKRRADFAERLRTALEERDAHAVSRS